MVTKEQTLKTTAIYSDDQKYRYSLTKVWDKGKPKATFIGINPSDATELLMDKTVMNLMNHLISNDYGQVEIVNLYAFRSKDQNLLNSRDNGAEKVNAEYIRRAVGSSELIIVGWGRNADKNAKYRDALDSIKQEILPFRERVKCFQDKKGNVNCHLSRGYSDEWSLVDYPLCLWQNENEQLEVGLERKN